MCFLKIHKTFISVLIMINYTYVLEAMMKYLKSCMSCRFPVEMFPVYPLKEPY